MDAQMHRLRVALAVLQQNLRGDGWDSLKPISAQFAEKMADLAAAALTGEPHDLLDQAVAKTSMEATNG